jgi:hypothetical protein
MFFDFFSCFKKNERKVKDISIIKEVIVKDNNLIKNKEEN